MDLVCSIAIVVGCSCLPSSTNRSSLRSWFSFCLSLSICSCDHPPCGKVYCLLVNHCCWRQNAMETCFALVMVAANDWAIRCCYGVLASFYELPIFWSHYFSYAKVAWCFDRMESVLCGRFAVTNKIADNLPFSPHRQQKTSIIVDFHGAALMCHIPALGLHVKIKFHFKK